VIGILDWELCTLGSPLADLGNLILPFSMAPITDVKPFEKIAGPSGLTGLLVGLKGLPSSETGMPTRDQIETWWVDGMNKSLEWHAKESGERMDRWSLPINNMGWVGLAASRADFRWVRSWILFRLAIIAQGIAARAALGQASSASARADDTIFNFYGKMAWEAKRDAEAESNGPKAKL